MTRARRGSGDEAKRRLVFFADPPYFGGAEEYIVMLAAACPRDGWEPAALIPDDEGGRELGRRLDQEGVAVERFRRRRWHDPALVLDLARRFRALRAQVVHMNLPSVYDSCLSMPAVAAKLAGCRRVVTTEHLPMVDRARRRMVVKMALVPWIDAIIVHTETNRGILARKHHMPSGRMRVIPNGSADCAPLSDGERRAARDSIGLAGEEGGILIAAGLTERKGHRFLFEALAALPAGLPAWRLLVMGKGEAEQDLRERVRALHLDGRVEFLGFRTDARRVIEACDLLVLPSLIETQPLVITEAMAARRPVVASAIFGIPEIVSEGRTGRLVPPGEVEPLRAVLAELVRDAEQRRRLGEAGRLRYEQEFTLERMAERTYAVLRGEAARGRN